ncbi:MBL fold metallo-hydrolase [Rufibacter sp. LB8]|uniref:MBL fold metallo-hydrolase n=2 Tax=Rufibacter sp. LB8 TaxID=2777781 RepID=UPI001CEF8917|nr:MBL fold metallo-hydrolase [Rufibacter sp. LB8]
MKKFMIILFSILGSVAAGGALFMAFAPEFGAAAQGQSLDRIKKSKQYKDGRFENVHYTPMMDESSFGEKAKIFVSFMKGVENSSPIDQLPMMRPTQAEYLAPSSSAAPEITWFGHSAVLIELDGKRIFADPMLGKRPSPVSFVGSKRFSDELPIKIEDLPPLDVVLLSHDHYDHLDRGSIRKLKDKTGHFVVPLGVKAHLVKWGVPENKITELDWWENTSAAGIEFVATPARHFSGRSLTDRNKTLWCSYVVKGQNHSIYFGGDSGYDTHFKEIGDKYGPFDLTMLECGQYNKAWQYIHMMPEQTAQAHLDLKGKVLMPTHWGAFSLALHPWKEPIDRLSKAAAQQNIQLATPIIGQRWAVGEVTLFKKWWATLE